ncbi:sarcosine oxidase subunit gamma [Sulfitobacter sp.]|uniref:sarcosine oxidase subunit gamma n=1 Tax=Sulfitobacter sp. TaxID=1903071 RepID=UPI0030033BAA
MHRLSPITALGGGAPRIDTVANLTLSENPDLALASVAARTDHTSACQAHLKALLGSDAPAPGKACLHDPELAFWTGPNQWMVAAPFNSHEDLVARLKAQFGELASITEQTDAWACFDLRGDGIAPVMELLCAINIRTMQTGDAARTVIHHLGCFVIRMTPEHELRILGPRASAGSLHHAILTAMTSAL